MAQLKPTQGRPTGPAGGDLTGTYPNPTLANNVVDTAELVDSAVTFTKINPSAITTDGTLSADFDTLLPTEQAVKTYVDALAAGLTPHPAVRLATALAALPAGVYDNGASGVGATFTVTATGTLSIDATVVNLNDRVLIKDQASAIQNGVYLCTTAGAGGIQAVLTRATDLNTGAELLSALYAVTGGSVNVNTSWYCTNTTAPVIGTDNITFAEFFGAVPGVPAGIEVVSPLQKAGRVVSLLMDGVTVDGSGSGGSLEVKPAGIGTTQLANFGPGATGPIGDGTHVAVVTIDATGRVSALTSVSISGAPPSGAAGGDLTGTYPNPTIAAAAVTLAKMANLAADSIIGNNTGSPATPIALTVAQTNALLLDNVTLDNGGSGGTAEIKAGGVGTTQLANNAVTLAKMATQANDTILSNTSGGVAVPSANTIASLQGTGAQTFAAGNDTRFTQIAATQQATAYTFTPSDAGTVVEGTDASAQTLTIDTHANQAIPVNSVIEVFQYGAGQITIAAAGGVTLRSDGSKVKTAAQYATIALRQRATDEWVISGDLA